jgi:hypothetical protein
MDDDDDDDEEEEEEEEEETEDDDEDDKAMTTRRTVNHKMQACKRVLRNGETRMFRGLPVETPDVPVPRLRPVASG